MVTLKDVFKQLVRDVKSEKLRTFLTIFGIVWGTVAISLMLAFGTGLHKQLVKSTAGLGDRIVIAWPGLTSIPYEGLGKGRRIRITDEDLERLQIRGTDTFSRIRLPDLLPLVEPAIVEQAQAAFPDAPASQAVVLRWHLRGLNFALAVRKAALSAQIEARKTARNSTA